MSIARLSIDLVANIAKFEEQMDQAAKTAEERSKKIFDSLDLKKIGGALIGGYTMSQIGHLIGITSDYADSMGKLAQKAGVTAEAMSKLSYASQLSDVDNQTLAKGLRELGEDAAKGGGKLKQLGIDLLDVQGKTKTSDELFGEVANRIAAIEDPAMKAATAAAIFGSKAGPELVPLLNSGAQGIKDMATEAERFGMVVSDKAVQASEAFNDNMTRLKIVLTGTQHQIGNLFIPELARLSNEFFLGMKNANGLADAIRTFGTMSVGLAPGEGIKKYRQELDDLIKSRDAYVRVAGTSASRSTVDNFDADIDRATRRVKYFQQLELLSVESSPDDETAAERRRLGLGAIGYVPPKSLFAGDEKKPKAAKAAEHDASAQALSAYVDQLYKQVQATQELSNVEESRLFLKGLGAIGEIEQVQDLVLGLARQKDAAEALKLSEKDRADEIAFRRALIVEEGEAINQANTAWQNYLQSLDDQTPDGRLEKQRKLMADLAAEFEAGRSTAEQFEQRVQVVFGGLPEKLKETDDIANKLGLTFSSAFEDAIVKGSSLKDMVNALGQDIMRIAVRKAITEPLGNAVGNLFTKVFSFDGGGYTGDGPRSGGLDGKGGYLAMLHPQETVVDHTKGGQVTASKSVTVQVVNNFNGPADRSQVLTAAQLGAAMARQQIRDDAARGRF